MSKITDDSLIRLAQDAL